MGEKLNSAVFSGVVVALHVIFAGENLVANYLGNVGMNIELHSLLEALLGSLLYSSVGILLGIIVFGPLAYFYVAQTRKDLMKSFNLALVLGLVCRLLSYLLPASG